MKIAILGTGGVGGYFGGRFAEGGEDVWFVARGRHLDALQRCGLRVKSRLGDILVKPIQATDDPAQIGPVDLVIVAVKLWDTADAVRAAAPLVGANTTIISFQNGVDAAEQFGAAFGAERVIGGVCHIAAAISGPGIIVHTGMMAKLTIGEFDRRNSPRIEAIMAACRKAGIDAHASDDIARAIWEKFIFLTAFSGITSLTRLSKGPILSDPDARDLFRAALAETASVARARGVRLSDDAVDRIMEFADSLPDEMKSSMLGDLERGNRLELPWLSGAVARLGAQAGVPTPIHRVIYQALKPYADGRAVNRIPV
jgi:2-dehydropantoate 2-reductase